MFSLSKRCVAPRVYRGSPKADSFLLKNFGFNAFEGAAGAPQSVFEPIFTAGPVHIGRFVLAIRRLGSDPTSRIFPPPPRRWWVLLMQSLPRCFSLLVVVLRLDFPCCSWHQLTLPFLGVADSLVVFSLLICPLSSLSVSSATTT